jgi:hypothetical protein
MVLVAPNAASLLDRVQACTAPTIRLMLTYSLQFYSPVLPPANSLAVSRTAQSPVPSAQLLARIACPGRVAEIASTLDLSVVARWASVTGGGLRSSVKAPSSAAKAEPAHTPILATPA